MDSIRSFERSRVRWTALRAVAEGGAIALAAEAVGRALLGRSASPALELGVWSACAASTLSAVWLLRAIGRTMRAFWTAFGGGIGLRAGVLGALAAWGWGRPGVSLEVLLLSYVLVLIATLLTLEFRSLRSR